MVESGLRGSCLCGGVEFEIHPPFVFFQYCFCHRCQKSSGSAHGSNIFVMAEQFRWTRGEDLVRCWELPEAKYYCTGWCDDCGSKLPWQSRNEKGFLVPVGSLDDEPEGLPEQRIYWASRPTWYANPEDLLTYDEGKKKGVREEGQRSREKGRV